MDSIERLKLKMEKWKETIESLKRENERLRSEISNSGRATSDCSELEKELLEKERVIEELRKELDVKDAEIEAIIDKVEELIE